MPGRYLEEPLSRDELEELRDCLGQPPAEWVRKGEKSFDAADLVAAGDDAALLDAIAAHPEILQRPILVRGGRARVGRPPEAILELV